jgi:hypothetical protein
VKRVGTRYLCRKKQFRELCEICSAGDESWESAFTEFPSPPAASGRSDRGPYDRVSMVLSHISVSDYVGYGYSSKMQLGPDIGENARIEFVVLKHHTQKTSKH